MPFHWPSDISSGANEAATNVFTNEAATNVFTKHETRPFPVARMVHVGTEALQSCFFRSGMLGVRREEPFLRSRDAKIRGANASKEKG